jgi:hypothetical protein
MHYQETLSTELLNSLKKQEVLESDWTNWNAIFHHERDKLVIQQTDINIRSDYTIDENGAEYSNVK